MSKFRQAVFPIENRELKKFIPFALIIFITVFNFTQLRNVKDSLVLTAPGAGGEVISYLKTGVVMPVVILFSGIYIELRKKFGFERAYQMIVSGFLIFFAVFNFVLYPNAEHIHMSVETINRLKAEYPRIQFVFPVIGAWSYSLYYLMAEMWGTFCLSVLFWQFANENIGTHEAKRFYPQFLLVNAFATLLVGLSMKVLGKVFYTNIVVVLSGLVMLAAFNYVNKQVLTDPRFKKDVVDTSKGKKKVRLSFMESIKQMASSPYIALISVIILSYGLSINMIETCWKSVAASYYPLQEDYYAMMANYSMYTGLSGIVLVFISKGLLRRFGWFPTAIVTPIIISITGAIYFSSVLFPNTFEPWILLAGFTSPTMFAVTFGMFGVILSKSAKYSFFDPTKELAYIPLDPDLRANGKAAADGVGGRLGKAGSGYIQIFLFTLTGGGLSSIMPFLAVILMILSCVWLVAVFKLSVEYKKALDAVHVEE